MILEKPLTDTAARCRIFFSHKMVGPDIESFRQLASMPVRPSFCDVNTAHLLGCPKQSCLCINAMNSLF